MVEPLNLGRLQEPFPANEIEWRVQQCGRGRTSNRIYARVLPYVTARAIQQRLDEVCGPTRWRNHYRTGPQGGVLCGISLYVDDHLGWVTKWDGAENTDVEGVKGGLSAAFKRCAVAWGCSRTLYYLPELYAHIHDKGRYRGRLPDRDGGQSYRWDPPELPAWALPGGQGHPPASRAA